MHSESELRHLFGSFPEWAGGVLGR
jgi:hypothetical protein